MELYSPKNLGNRHSSGADGASPLIVSVIMLCLCVGLLAAYIYSPVVAIALSVSLLVAIVCLQRVQLFMVAIFALMPFPISIVGAESAVNVSPSDCIAALFMLMLPMYLLGGKRISLGPMGVPLAIFLVINITSGCLFFDGFTTFVTLLRVFMMTAVALTVYSSSQLSLTTMRRCLTSFLVGINVLLAFCFAALITGGMGAAEYTLGIQKNTLGITFGCAIVISIGLLIYGGKDVKSRNWILATLVGATFGIVITLSRGSWIATGVGVLFLLLRARRIRAFLIIVIVLIPSVWLVWTRLPSESIEYATDISLDSYNIHSRTRVMEQAMKLYQSSPIYGVGIGLRKSIEPHNIIVSTLAETGIVGLIGLLLFVGGGFYTFFRAGRAARGNVRATEIVVIASAVYIVSLGHALMDVYWRRGTPFMAWACVGMCIYIAKSSGTLLGESVSRQNAAPAIE